MANPIIDMVEVKKVYGGGVKTEVLKGVSLQIARGEFLSIIGPSGSGKSTLLNLLGALDKPTSGQIRIDGDELSRLNDNQLADIRNRKLGFVFQFHHLLPEFTALENVIMPSWILGGRAAKKTVHRARELMEMVGLAQRMNNKAGNLSGGQQQRVAMARALMNNPPIVLADEPTGNLDSESTEQVYELMRDINRELKTTFVIITHDPNIASRTDRTIELLDGQILPGSVVLEDASNQ